MANASRYKTLQVRIMCNCCLKNHYQCLRTTLLAIKCRKGCCLWITTKTITNLSYHLQQYSKRNRTLLNFPFQQLTNKYTTSYWTSINNKTSYGSYVCYSTLRSYKDSQEREISARSKIGKSICKWKLTDKTKRTNNNSNKIISNRHNNNN